jgi:hypothetical protein
LRPRGGYEVRQEDGGDKGTKHGRKNGGKAKVEEAMIEN